MGTENLNPHVLVTKTLPRVAAEMALHILAYNMTRILGIMAFDLCVPKKRREQNFLTQRPDLKTRHLISAETGLPKS